MDISPDCFVNDYVAGMRAWPTETPPPPLLVIDPELAREGTDGSVTRVTIATESRRF